MSATTPIQTTTLKAAALNYAAQGVAVFPLGTHGERRKKPLLSSVQGGQGYKDATTDEAQIRAWWGASPNANIGRPTGRQYGTLVIDDDPRHDGPASLAKLEAKYGPLPRTHTVRSGGGGGHRYFRHPGGFIKSGDNRFGDEYPGVDVKADGGYVVAPPSIHPNGSRYLVTDDAPLAELPQAWLDALLATQAPPTPPETAKTLREDCPPGDGKHCLDWALDQKREGTADKFGYELAQQLLVNNVPDPEYWLQEYAVGATYDPAWPFTEKDMARWLKSAEQSRIVRNGQPARSSTPKSPRQPEHSTMRQSVRTSRQQPQATGGDDDCGGEDEEAEDGAAEAAGEESGQQEAKQGGREPSQASKLVELVLATGTELFHTPDDDPYATIRIAGHRETWSLRSQGFTRWLKYLYYTAYDRAPGADAIRDGRGVLEGLAIHEGGKIPVWTRVARYEDAIYIDMADAAWQAIKITVMGWQVVESAPVRFRRAPGMLPLPEPAHRGDADTLRSLINVSDEDWPLLQAFMVAALRETGPYPVLALCGEQGSAKTSMARMLRSLIDPNEMPVRSAPREERDLAIAATNGWLPIFDNLDHIQPWLSNALCRMSTGGGFSTRALYTDDAEMIFKLQRPVIMTSITDIVSRSDLLDRSVILHLPAIPERERKSEVELSRQFELMGPAILGGLLDTVSRALKQLPKTKLETLPRMADFALWAVASEKGANDGKDSTFLKAYTKQREETNEMALEASPIAKVLLTWWEKRKGVLWQGTAGELLGLLEDEAGENVVKRRDWPKLDRLLADDLRRIAPNLRAHGVNADQLPRTRGRRLWKIETSPLKDGFSASPASQRHESRQEAALDGDADGDAGDAENGPASRSASHVDAQEFRVDAAGDAGDAGDADFPTLTGDVCRKTGEAHVYSALPFHNDGEGRRLCMNCDQP